jgi:urease alpha subunit
MRATSANMKNPHTGGGNNGSIPRPEKNHYNNFFLNTQDISLRGSQEFKVVMRENTGVHNKTEVDTENFNTKRRSIVSKERIFIEDNTSKPHTAIAKTSAGTFSRGYTKTE